MERVSIRLALAAALIVAGPAAYAQPAAESGEATEGATSAMAPVEETREETLDRLLVALASARGDDAERIANEINALWSQSGSASMDFLLRRARDAINSENYPRARAHLAALTRLAPDFAEAWNASATLYFIEDEYWIAVEHIERALALEPRHFGALTGLALILERVDRDASALAAWREVGRLYPALEGAQQAIDRLAPEVDGRDL